MIKERPILFNSEMVNAILDECKTHTRRENGLKDINKNPDRYEFLKLVNEANEKQELYAMFWDKVELKNVFVKSPLGKIGDRLWVRETTEADHTTSECTTLSKYSSNKAPVLYSNCEDEDYNGSIAHWDYSKPVRPSIHMKRNASRITLEITNVRVERLNDISEEDAKAEGCSNDDDPYWIPTYNDPDSGGKPSCKNSFEWLWDSIYNNWNENPYVWVVEFKVVK